HVAAAFRQRGLAIHHAGACGFTKVLDHRRCDCRHRCMSFALSALVAAGSCPAAVRYSKSVLEFGRPEFPADASLLRFRGKGLGLRYPGIRPARQADFFANLVGCFVVEFGELPVVENTEIVELLLDRTRDAWKL